MAKSSPRGSYVWFNGTLVPESECRISLFTHALHYGSGAFEGIRVYTQKNGRGGIFRLEEHIQRLFESAKILGLTPKNSQKEVVQGCIDTAKKNGFSECYLRPLLFVGDGPLGVSYGATPPVHIAILAWEWGSYLGDKGISDGVRLKTSSYIRPHPNSSMTKAKATGNYVMSTLAKMEAINAGFDEALLLDPNGFLSEGSGENLFLIKNGKVKTTPLTSILEGITRATILEYLAKKGIPVQETVFTRDELICADEVFLTGTAAEITPVKEIDLRTIGSGKPGPITLDIVKMYHDLVRGEEVFPQKKWITLV